MLLGFLKKLLRVVAHLTHTWLLRGHISKTTCTIDFKLHMSIKQLSNTTHTKKKKQGQVLQVL